MDIIEQVKELRKCARNIQINEQRDWDIVDMLLKASGTIESFSAKLQEANMERSDRYYNGGWIPCEDRLPEDGVDVLVWFEYFRYGEYDRLFQTTGISYMYNGKWSGFVNGQSG